MAEPRVCALAALLAALLAVGTAAAARAGDACQMSKNSTCVLVHECPQIIELIVHKEFELVRKEHCGWNGKEPLVCCKKDGIISQVDNPVPSTTVKNNETYDKTEQKTTINDSKITDPYDQFYPVDSFMELSPVTAPTAPASTTPTTSLTTPTHASTPMQATTLPVEDTVNRHHDSSPDTFNENGSSLLPGFDECGTTIKVVNRIYGGTTPGVDELPWMAQIMYTHRGKSLNLCAGALISHRYVVTAAHCLQSAFKLVSVRLGEFNMSTEVDCMDGVCNQPPLDVAVEQAILYPQFSRRLLTKYDIGLLRLSHAVNFTDFIRPICLPLSEYARRHDYIPEASYIAAGWGKTTTAMSSEVLQKVVLKGVAMDTCKVAVEAVRQLEEQTGIICAGGRLGEDTCTGDSGGPLIRSINENYTNHWYLFGVTSFGLGCGREGFPSIYTRVTSYTDWIISNLRP